MPSKTKWQIGECESLRLYIFKTDRVKLSTAFENSLAGCIEIASSDEGSDIEECVAETNRTSPGIGDKSFEELAAGLLPEFLQMYDAVQVISDDEECGNRIEISSSQSSDVEEIPETSEPPGSLSTSPAQSQSSDTEDSAHDLYPTYSLQNIPPMRRLRSRLDSNTEVGHWTRARAQRFSASTNVSLEQQRCKQAADQQTEEVAAAAALPKRRKVKSSSCQTDPTPTSKLHSNTVPGISSELLMTLQRIVTDFPESTLPGGLLERTFAGISHACLMARAYQVSLDSKN